MSEEVEIMTLPGPIGEVGKKQALKIMRSPFEAHQISKMCKPTKRDNQPGRCKDCGGWHKLPSVQLSYVGHAALTDRLLEADPEWTWEPLSYAPDGTPLIDRDGGMWIKLTVAGVTRLGYGDSQGKIGGDATKERIGDALRNAAMRFGAALELWHKGTLHPGETTEEDDKAYEEDFDQRTEGQRSVTQTNINGWNASLKNACRTEAQIAAYFKKLGIREISEMQRQDFDAAIKWLLNPDKQMDLTDQLKDSVKEVPKKSTLPFPKLFALAREKGIPEDDVKRYAYETYKIDSMSKLTPLQFDEVKRWVDLMA